MADRLRALVPRILVVGAVWIVASGTLTFAADKTLTARAPAKAPVAAAPKPTLIVPDVRSQAYVFAKGILADAGFAWRVVGAVRGYSTNVVASQRPAPGARVVDTGAPTIELRLARGRYGQSGSPEDAAPYPGTAARLVSGLNARAKKPAPPKLANKKRARPKKTAVLPRVRSRAKRPAKRVEHRLRQRPPAFRVPGAPKEPLDEISLPARAQRLEAWLAAGRLPTPANQRHWLYQHAWIVAGARFGWWHGATALRTLIRVDRRVEREWGLGRRSEAVARAALAAVDVMAK